MVNTYACKCAIKVSKKKSIVTTIHGKTEIIIKKCLIVHNPQAKPIKIFNNACPAIILANKRILKLKTLAIYDKNSIKTKNGIITIGILLGKKILKLFHLFWKIKIIFIPIK